MANTASIENSFNINKLLDYLPLIIVCVIILVGFFTWEVVKNEMASFMMLILVFLYAVWIMKGDTNSYRKWLGTNLDEKYIFPPMTQNPFEGYETWLGVAIFSFVALGLGLGFGSIGISQTTGNVANTINTLNVFGGIFSIGGIVLVIYSLWKIFRNDDDATGATAAATDDDKSTTKRAGLGGFIGSVLGFYMVARAKIIENDGKEIVGDPGKEKEYQASILNNGASTALASGLILQVIGYALIFAVFICYNKFASVFTMDRWGVAKAILVTGFVLCGILWIAKSQNWPGFNDSNTGAKPVDSFDNNVFAAHGGIYIIFAVIFLVSILGKLEKSTTYYWFGMVLTALFIGCYSWNIADMVKQQNTDNITDEQTQILSEEVRKELKKKAPIGTEVTEEAVKDAVVKRIQAKQKPSEIINIVFTILSVVIMMAIIIFRNTRMRLGICGGLPTDGVSWWKNIFTSITTPPDTTGGLGQGYCANLDTKLLDPTIQTKAYDKVKNGEIDNVTGPEWDSLLNTYDDNIDAATAAAGGKQNIDSMIVRTAKGAMWIPFLLVILIVAWVTIIFVRVSNAEATNVWIANSFTGEMFPKVKELIDTFFIVLIVGLLLCGILMMPFVKELNVGGLDNILKAVESIQVWQYDSGSGSGFLGSTRNKIAIIVACIIGVAIISTGTALLFKFDLVPKETKGIVATLISMVAICTVPGWYFIISDEKPASAFKNESTIFRWIRLFFTAIYLIPWLIFTLFKLVLFGIPGFFNDTMRKKRDEEFTKLAFWDWTSAGTDLRLFTTGAPIKPEEVISPESVTSMPPPDYSDAAQTAIKDAAAAVGATQAAKDAKDEMEKALQNKPAPIDQKKVGAVGKLIKVVFLTISFVIMILATIYMVYKVGANNRTTEQDAASGGFVSQLNSPTAHAIYVIMTIVGIAGLVAYIREKFTKVNSKTPEDYLFDDYKPEDTAQPMRQLTFGMTHIIYIVLMIIVWVYDTDTDDRNRMSVTGMTVLGIAILFFHYFLEFIDNKESAAPGDAPGAGTEMAPMSNLLTNIRFIVNTVFFIILCVLAYYKQHSVMVVLIVVMFLFHLTKSVLGMKLLRLIWLCIIYIPCLFLGILTSSQGAVGDTTRPIWIIIAIEILLIAILYGGPYLLNYIGASNSQIIAAPVPLRPKNDTTLTTQSPQIFIFHNTALNRSDDDKAANCAPEEKKRYNYSVSGWFWINNNVTARDYDLEIFNFGGVPKLTYNPATTEFKVSCKTVSLSTGMPDTIATEVYNSRYNYSNIKNLSKLEKDKFDILNDSHTTDTQIPIQKWNYFVINYDGKSMDVFLNNSLVAKSNFFVPDITMQPITSGDGGETRTSPQGLSGNICNVSFHKEPMTLEQIRWTYNMLKSQDPPMVGMKTIADEVKSTGNTNVYSQK